MWVHGIPERDIVEVEWRGPHRPPEWSHATHTRAIETAPLLVAVRDAVGYAAVTAARLVVRRELSDGAAADIAATTSTDPPQISCDLAALDALTPGQYWYYVVATINGIEGVILHGTLTLI